MLLRTPSSSTTIKMIGLSMNPVSLRRNRTARSILDEGRREGGHGREHHRFEGWSTKRSRGQAQTRFARRLAGLGGGGRPGDNKGAGPPPPAPRASPHLPP